MVFHNYLSTKKTFYYNFFPTKAEEDEWKARGSPPVPHHGRVLVEIRDIYPPPMMHPAYPWMITKTLNPFEVASGKILLSFNDLFDHVLRYWDMGHATSVSVGNRVAVSLYDVTDEKNPKLYQGLDVYLQMLPNDDAVVGCMNMMLDRKLKVDDKYALCWDDKEMCFKFKLI